MTNVGRGNTKRGGWEDHRGHQARLNVSLLISVTVNNALLAKAIFSALQFDPNGNNCAQSSRERCVPSVIALLFSISYGKVLSTAAFQIVMNAKGTQRSLPVCF